MLVREFDFDLPPELIAQEPSRDRTSARLLHLARVTGALTHAHISDLPSFLRAGDLVVANDTRVFPARLLGHRTPSGGAVECLLVGRSAGREGLERQEGQDGLEGLDGKTEQFWDALVHPGQKLKPGARMVFGDGALWGEVIGRGSFGRRLVRLWTEGGRSVDAAVDAVGHVPLPPYIKRPDDSPDRERYQTVFADRRGSVAAPTAGLHFTRELLERLHAGGVETCSITLHVGYGTFQPVRVEEVEAHRLHPERYEISPATADAIARARTEQRRVIAVGTTTTRTLEAVAKANDGAVVAGRGETDLFIYPGFTFRVIAGLLTNFHVPKSSLLMLVSAFAGVEAVRQAYRVAVEQRYRFYSYGDAMLIT
jgi:S-adenosylmethionine:tRNA ribosyltransferase-isomerase